MYRLFHQKQSIIITEATEKEFRSKYPGPYELVRAVSDCSNIDAVVTQLQKIYKTNRVVRDYKIPRKLAIETRRAIMKNWTPEQKQRHLRTSKPRGARAGDKLSEQTKAKISNTMKGKSNFEGKKHHITSKVLIAVSRYGKTPLEEGQNWCHHPSTGEELRCIEAEKPQDYKWGRCPGMLDYPLEVKRLRQKMRLRQFA